MSRYSEQFKRDGVALYENNEDLSLNSASAELGINRASLHSWVKKYGTGKRARIKAVHDKAQAANDSARIRQLEKEVLRLPSFSGHPISTDPVSVGEDVHCEFVKEEIHPGVPA